jgi:hypothetical protein
MSVSQRLKTMSAMAAAFAESGHGGPFPTFADSLRLTEVRQLSDRPADAVSSLA